MQYNTPLSLVSYRSKTLQNRRTELKELRSRLAPEISAILIYKSLALRIRPMLVASLTLSCSFLLITRWFLLRPISLLEFTILTSMKSVVFALIFFQTSGPLLCKLTKSPSLFRCYYVPPTLTIRLTTKLLICGKKTTKKLLRMPKSGLENSRGPTTKRIISCEMRSGDGLKMMTTQTARRWIRKLLFLPRHLLKT